jgi:hypothetical protein
MRRTLIALLPLVLPALLLSACERVKSATPLSPSIAGPIAGVEISQPSVVAPSDGTRIASTQQPISLVVGNATSNGVRPLTYMFEIASDANFASKVFTQTGVQPGDGQTSFRLPQSLGSDRSYFWRVKAYDGANEGDYSAPIRFTVYTPIVIGKPGLADPLMNATTTTTKPILEVHNGTVTGPAGPIHYLFELATDQAMANKVFTVEVAAGTSTNMTAYGVPNDLQTSTQYYWHAQAFDTTSSARSPWSDTFAFVTPAVKAVPPGGGGGSAPTTAPNDQIDMRNVIIAKGADIRSWAVTSTMTSVTHKGDELCTYHTMAGRWPVLPFFDDPSATIEGNQWFFALIGGQWYGGANEWLRPGQTCKEVAGNIGPDNIGGSTPMGKWTPHPGERLGIAVSTPARAGQQGTAERSNVVLITW